MYMDVMSFLFKSFLVQPLITRTFLFEDFQSQKLSKMVDLSKFNINFLQKPTDYQLEENEDFNASDFVDLSEILLGKNIYARKLHDKIQDIIGRQEIREGDIKRS